MAGRDISQIHVTKFPSKKNHKFGNRYWQGQREPKPISNSLSTIFRRNKNNNIEKILKKIMADGKRETEEEK